MPSVEGTRYAETYDYGLKGRQDGTHLLSDCLSVPRAYEMLNEQESREGKIRSLDIRIEG